MIIIKAARKKRYYSAIAKIAGIELARMIPEYAPKHLVCAIVSTDSTNAAVSSAVSKLP